MKIKNQNCGSERSRKAMQGQDTKPERFSFLRLKLNFCIFICSFLAVCPIVSNGYAKTGEEELDPVSLLDSHLSQRSQDVNTLNMSKRLDTPQIEVSEPQSAQAKVFPGSNVAVNFLANAAYQHGPNTVSSFEVWQDLTAPAYDESSKPASSLQNNLLVAKSPTTNLGRQLWHARISAPEDKENKLSKNELQQIIKQVGSVEFKPQEQPVKPIIVVGPVLNAEPNEIESDTEAPQEQSPQKNEKKLPYEQVTEQTLQKLKDLSQHPEQLQNPFELAEILFNCRCLREAAKCYHEALSRMTTNEADPFQNRAWLLFQTGNCLQNDDPQAAMQMYKQLITEYPNSPWTDLAKTKSKLIDWYLSDKPRALINENKL